MTMKELLESIKSEEMSSKNTEYETKLRELKSKITETDRLIEEGYYIMNACKQKIDDLRIAVPEEIRFMRRDRDEIEQFEMENYQKIKTEEIMVNAMLAMKEELEEELESVKEKLRDARS